MTEVCHFTNSSSSSVSHLPKGPFTRVPHGPRSSGGAFIKNSWAASWIDFLSEDWHFRLFWPLLWSRQSLLPPRMIPRMLLLWSEKNSSIPSADHLKNQKIKKNLKKLLYTSVMYTWCKIRQWMLNETCSCLPIKCIRGLRGAKISSPANINKTSLSVINKLTIENIGLSNPMQICNPIKKIYSIDNSKTAVQFYERHPQNHSTKLIINICDQTKWCKNASTPMSIHLHIHH